VKMVVRYWDNTVGLSVLVILREE